MKTSIQSVFLTFVSLTVLLSGCAPAPTPVPPTSTPSPVPSTSTPEATATPVPSPTLEPTAVPTIPVLPQQWNGTYTYPTGEIQRISLLIEKMTGTTFRGKMIWQSYGSSKGAILKMNGEYITDFGDEVEQARWNNLEDYKNGGKDGTWLRWTETELIDGANYTVNGWYYAHIREDGTMVAVYFFNKTEIVADSGTFSLRQVTP